MSADLLREAAGLMRERAQAVDGWYSAAAWATTHPLALPIEQADAEHIASWHPAVALAVADWLGSEDTHRFGPTEHAINVARAYLGRDT